MSVKTQTINPLPAESAPREDVLSLALMLSPADQEWLTEQLARLAPWEDDDDELPESAAYIRAAMGYAQYQILEDNSFYGEIAPLAGVYPNAETLEGCGEELQEVLQGWILLGLRLGHFLPPVDGIQLDIVANNRKDAVFVCDRRELISRHPFTRNR